jgi:hypothetical protein
MDIIDVDVVIVVRNVVANVVVIAAANPWTIVSWPIARKSPGSIAIPVSTASDLGPIGFDRRTNPAAISARSRQDRLRQWPREVTRPWFARQCAWFAGECRRSVDIAETRPVRGQGGRPAPWKGRLAGKARAIGNPAGQAGSRSAWQRLNRWHIRFRDIAWLKAAERRT